MKNRLTDLIFSAFDIETTSLTPVKDRIVEIGSIKFRNGEIIDTFQEMIDPEMPISPGASAVNGITGEMVRGQPTIEQVLPRFLSFIDGSVPVAHNASFDVGFLAYDISRFALTPTANPILDTMKMAKNCYPYLYNYSLDNLAWQLNIQSDGLHRALADARACMELFSMCLKKIDLYGKLSLSELIDFNGPPLYFRIDDIDLQGTDPVLKRALKTGETITIVYRDASGFETSRTITPLTAGYSHGVMMIEAFCHLRNEKRCFRLDRIVEIR